MAVTSAPPEQRRRPGESDAPEPVPILLYHSVSTDDTGLMRRFTTTPSRFRSHLGWIAAHGFSTLTVSEYAAALRGATSLPDRPLVVTFDDGYADFIDVAAPLLDQYAIRATLYVTTAPIGGTQRGTMAGRPMLTWSELRQVAALGVEIGGHGHDHAQLDVVPAGQALHQVTICKRLIEDRVQVPVRSFAYPHGHYSVAAREAVRAAGYSSACAVKNARSHQRDDLWALARVMVEHDDGPELLWEACTGGRYPLSSHRVGARTRGWRVARRLRARLHSGTLAPPITTGDTPLPD